MKKTIIYHGVMCTEAIYFWSIEGMHSLTRPDKMAYYCKAIRGEENTSREHCSLDGGLTVRKKLSFVGTTSLYSFFDECLKLKCFGLFLFLYFIFC